MIKCEEPVMNNNSLETSLKIQLWISRIFTVMFIISVIAMGSVYTYWKYEPDPLQVEAVAPGFSVCQDRQFSFKRYVKSDKDLKIYVQNRWHDDDGFTDQGDVKGELVLSKPDFYPLGADFTRVMTFHKEVPHEIPAGNYTYQPIATYELNPIKTITRPLPAQKVQVVCDYDPDKHNRGKK